MVSRQYAMYAAFAVWAVLMYMFLVTTVRNGQPVPAILAVLFASPLLLAILAMALEDATLREVIDLKHGSWSFLIGDSIALTSASAFAALAWRDIPHEGWITSWWWTLSCALLGLLAGAGFHKWDSGNYRKDFAGDRLLSPTKMAHDFVAYPVLFGALVCIGVPLLLHWSWHTWALLGCVGLWVICVVCDGFRSLDAFRMHPGWSEYCFFVIDDRRPSPYK